MSKKKLGTRCSPVPVVDLFAGPGGLGEGFSRAGDEKLFRTVLSVEMESHAHSTLQVRAFQRQLPKGGRTPSLLTDLVRNEITQKEIFSQYPEEWGQAQREALHCELGVHNRKIFKSIEERLGHSIKNGRWILIGGPPCQAYSLAGRARNSRARRNGTYSPENDFRHFLYTEYLKTIARYRPAVFVMENVMGMLSAKVSGVSMFDKILSDLRNPGGTSRSNVENEYKLYSVSEPEPDSGDPIPPNSFIVKCENYGIPQRRHRVVIVGIRADFYHCPRKLKLTEQPPTTCKDSIDDLPPLRSRLSRGDDTAEEWQRVICNADWRYLIGAGARGPIHASQMPLYTALRDACKKLVGPSSGKGGYGALVIPSGNRYSDGPLASWYHFEKNSYVYNHETRFHMDSDLWRYLFASTMAKLEGQSPKLPRYPKALLPNHRNVATSIRTKAFFADRFRVQIANEPATTITSHIAKDGHGFIHYNPTQCRTLTVREVARLQTFPDDYCFFGPRTAQYRQVGNAVPPYLAYQIAEAIANAMG